MSNLVNIKTNSTMTSREIAELTGKQHKNIVRDIRNMIEQIPTGSGLSWLCEQSTYTDAKGEERTQYLLDYDATLTLVSGYNVDLRLRIIKRWRELEAGAPPVAPPISLLEEQERRVTMSERMVALAERINDDVLIVLAADNVKNAFAAKALPSPDQGLFQIHEVLENELGMSPSEINKSSNSIGRKVSAWYKAQGKEALKTKRFLHGATRTVNAYPACDRSAVVSFIRTL